MPFDRLEDTWLESGLAPGGLLQEQRQGKPVYYWEQSWDPVSGSGWNTWGTAWEVKGLKRQPVPSEQL